MLSFSILTITLALLWYSIAVWAERFSKRLKLWHTCFFWIGLISDATGTISMSLIRKTYAFDVHGLTGLFALMLMLFHAVWATTVLIRKNEKLIISFHKFSMIVWLIWLIPYISGVIMHMK